MTSGRLAQLSRAAWLALVVLGLPAAAAEPDRADERHALVAEIEAEVRWTASYLGRDRLDPRVLGVLAKVPRHEFVPPSLRARAYENRPLPIGYGQTISQPYIVAIMTDLLDLEPDDRVLEIGTGSGYQAAVLAGMVARVHTLEIIPQLGESAAARLSRLGYDNVEVRIADGYHGWPEKAPFDAVMVTAAAGHVPPPLVRQLAPGGRMMIPVGGPFSVQHLLLVTKSPGGEVRTRQVLPVAFVPLTGDH